MTESIYKLWHYKIGAEDEGDNEDDAQAAKLIGMFSTKEQALAGLDTVKDKPGFRDWPEGFRIGEASVDLEQWVGGFVSWAEVGDDE